jgi:hypothetical protein
MANHTTNDRNENVIAVGAPSSKERLRVKFPETIDVLSRLDKRLETRRISLMPGFSRQERETLLELAAECRV